MGAKNISFGRLTQSWLLKAALMGNIRGRRSNDGFKPGLAATLLIAGLTWLSATWLLGAAPARAQTAPDTAQAGYAALPARDYPQALRLLEEAANEGDSNAEQNLGARYGHGWDVAQDYTQALAWFQKSAAQGNTEAEYDLGIMYAHGRGIVANPQQARDWFRKAAARRAIRTPRIGSPNILSEPPRSAAGDSAASEP